MKTKASSLLKIAISLFFIALLVFIMRDKIKDVFGILRKANPLYFVSASILYILIMIILSARLRKVMAVQNVMISVKNVTYLSLVGFFFNNFLPTSVAGDVVKAHYTARYTAKTLESYTSVIIDRIFGLVSFVFIASFALIFADRGVKSPLVIRIILAMITCSLVALYLISTDFITKRAGRFLAKFKFLQFNSRIPLLLDAIARYRGNMRVILFALYTSVVAQVISVFIVIILARGLSVNISLGLVFLALPIITIISMLPSLNGLGIREGAYVFFLGKYIGKEQALSISILWLGVILTVSFVGGIVYFLKDKLLKGDLKQ